MLANVYDVEVTDTFGGEANYCWVRRYKVRIPLMDSEGAAERKKYEARIKREIKKAASMTGVRGNWSDFGQGYEFRPRNACIVLFATYNDYDNDDDQGDN